MQNWLWVMEAQTYIDVVLTGCLAISVDFAAEFIQTTWHPPHVHAHHIRRGEDYAVYAWVNDRTFSPRYMRAEDAATMPLDMIETMLSNHIPVASALRFPAQIKD
jgi:hypothetical protein